MNNEVKNIEEKLKEIRNVLEKFETKEEAIQYLVQKTKLSEKECTIAYDFFIKLDLDQKKKEG